MKTIAPAIQNFRGFAFTSLEMNAVVKTTKKDRITKEPFVGVVTKRQVFKNIGLGADYQKTVNSRLKTEGKVAVFVAESLPYGEWKEDSKTVITHKDEDYLRLYKHENTTCEVQYFLDGVQVKESDLPDVLPAKKKISGSYRQDAHELEKKVLPFTVKASNIVQLNFNGEQYN